MGQRALIGFLSSTLDRFRGSGDSAVTIPSMDGAFRPNHRLDQASSVLEIDAPDNLAYDGRRILFSSGSTLFELTPNMAAASERIAEYEHQITAVGVHPTGVSAIGLAGGEIHLLGGSSPGRRLKAVEGRPLRCLTALHFADSETLLVCLGSQQNDPAEWARDLLAGNSSGSLWRININSGNATCLADRLAWPNGVVVPSGGRTVVAEAWRNRLIDASSDRLRSLLTEIPGYPGRIALAGSGGYWLSIFAPRSQLVEFILREPQFRQRMMQQIDPEFWVAPSLHKSRDYREPLQAGAIKKLGEAKPWAPSFSYGLIAGLNPDFGAIESLHSRADGIRHGITSCIEVDGRLFATSKGGNVILSVDLDRTEGAPK